MTPEPPDIRDLLSLVLGIARLGENDLQDWWTRHALGRTGQYVLSSMFRPPWRPAALQLDVSVATRMHDELLGRSTALHTFSDGCRFADRLAARSASDMSVIRFQASRSW